MNVQTKEAIKDFYDFIQQYFFLNAKTTWGKKELESKLKDIYIDWLYKHQGE